MHNMPKGIKVICLGILEGVILLVDENSRGNSYLIYVIKPLEGNNYVLEQQFEVRIKHLYTYK